MGTTCSAFTNCLSFCFMTIINNDDSGSDFEIKTRKQKNKLQMRRRRKQKWPIARQTQRNKDKTRKLTTRKRAKNKSKAAKRKRIRAEERVRTEQQRTAMSVSKKIAREQRLAQAKKMKCSQKQKENTKSKKWLDEYDKTFDPWTSNEPPHPEYLKAFTQYPKAALAVQSLRVPPTVCHRYAPNLAHPLGHQKEVCRLCSVFELLRILAYIRENPRDLTLDFSEIWIFLPSTKIAHLCLSLSIALTLFYT